MKQIILTLLLLPLFSVAQINKEQPQEKTKIESFSDKAGTLIQKTFIDIGKVASLNVQVLLLEDVTNKTKISGLRLEASVYSSLGSETKVAFLDKDEITGLLQTLNYFKENVFASKPADYTEVTFSSRSGFSTSAFQDGKAWSVVFKLEKYDSRSKVYFKEKDISELISVIEKAKEKL